MKTLTTLAALLLTTTASALDCMLDGTWILSGEVETAEGPAVLSVMMDVEHLPCFGCYGGRHANPAAAHLYGTVHQAGAMRRVEGYADLRAGSVGAWRRYGTKECSIEIEGGLAYDGEGSVFWGRDAEDFGTEFWGVNGDRYTQGVIRPLSANGYKLKKHIAALAFSLDGASGQVSAKRRPATASKTQ